MENTPNTFSNTSASTGGGEAPLGHIDQYRLIRKLGKGAFGVVYLAKDDNDVEFAMKSVQNAGENEIARLRETFRRISVLEHPHIAGARVVHKAQNVEYFDKETADEFGVRSGDYAMIMSFAPGETLKSYRRNFEREILPVETALDICRWLAEAIDYANGKGIIHCDIKPGNIMVESASDGSAADARLLDFGLARHVDPARSASSSGKISGTPGYMAPEQWSGGEVTVGTDQYALAVVLYEMLSGTIPFADALRSGGNAAMAAAVLTRIPYSLRGITYRQNRVLRKALAKTPKARYASCVEFISDFAGTKTGESTGFAALGKALVSSVRDSIGDFFFKFTKKMRKAPAEAVGGVLPDISGRSIIEASISEMETIRYKVSDAIGIKCKLEHTRVELGNKTVIELVTIPPTAFTMGSPGSEIGRAASEKMHKVTLTKPFRIALTQVKQSTWEYIMGNNPSSFRHGGHYPVEQVSIDDCREFVAKLNSDYPCEGWRWVIPTDAEWECACRAGDKGPFSGNGDIEKMGWYSGNSNCATHPVAQKAPNKYGLYDMHGNVWEWCRDSWVERLPIEPQTDPEEKNDSGKYVSRGGSWNNSAALCRSATRHGYAGTSRFDSLGLRLAMEKL